MFHRRFLKTGACNSNSNFFTFHWRSPSIQSDLLYLPQPFHHANLSHTHLSMSGTCIVCLRDLGDVSSDSCGLATPSAKSPVQDGGPNLVITAPNLEFANDNRTDIELIAHLKPCGHNLHNDCLTPWVERANSCPICRARFYTVELSKKVGGNETESMPCTWNVD